MNKVTAQHVLLYIPNLIGYFRIICTTISFVLMICVPSRWALAIGLYFLSFVFDLFDGVAARKFDQTSSFGGLLDMVTDRCSTTGLLYVLQGEYVKRGDAYAPFYALLFLFLILIDISSHWCQMYSTSSLQNQHHKSTSANLDRICIVRWYYQIYVLFGYCCVGAELTYISLFVLLHFKDDDVVGVVMNYDGDYLLSLLFKLLLMICIPACVLKQIVNVTQLCSACFAVASCDAKVKNS